MELKINSAIHKSRSIGIRRFVCLFVLCFLSFNTLAVDRQDFRIKDVRSWLSRTGTPPLTSSGSRAGGIYTFYMLPVENPGKMGFRIRWELKREHQGTDYGNALLARVMSKGTVTVKSPTRGSSNFSIKPTRRGNVVTAVVKYQDVQQHVGGNQFIVSLQVVFDRNTNVYSNAYWEPRIELQAKRGPNPKSSFSRLLKSTFDHEKCMGCHAFQTNSIGQEHRASAKIPDLFNQTISDVNTCRGCHSGSSNPRYADNWHAPVGMDWSTMNAQATVAMITAPPFDTKAKMKHHLKTDTLINWSISKMGKKKRLRWRRSYEKWIKSWKRDNKNP